MKIEVKISETIRLQVYKNPNSMACEVIDQSKLSSREISREDAINLISEQEESLRKQQDGLGNRIADLRVLRLLVTEFKGE